MGVKVDPLLCEAMLRLRMNPDWSRFVAFVEANRAVYMAATTTLVDDVQLRRAQGGFAALDDLMKTIVDADKTYNKFKGNTP